MSRAYAKLLCPCIFFLISFQAIDPLTALGKGAIITVDPGESIQAAIDKASSGDIIEVRSGTYRENLDINKRLTLQGIDSGNGKPAISYGSDNNEDLITLSADGCIVRGLMINSSENNAITILSDSNSVSDNLITGNSCCIYLNRTSFDNITNNVININGARHRGILLTHSSNNSIKNNTICFNGLLASGIDLASSLNNAIVENKINGNGWLGDSGISVRYSNSNFINHNVIKTIGLWGSCIYIKASANNKILNNDLEHGDISGSGITLFGADDNYIMHNKAKCKGQLNCAGIFLRHSDNNHIMDNEVNSTGVFGSGISLIYSDNNEVERNEASKNTYGIYLYSADKNSINANIGRLNRDADIYLDFYSPRTTMKNNQANIVVVLPHDNIIKDNTGSLKELYNDPMPDDLPVFTITDIADLVILILQIFMN
ncbi:MAG: nitrous oxide reductase family maturation protein NosD [Methanotrichaceae archaeon]